MEITVGSQVDIFMLVEDLELAGIHVVSLNTDGVVVLMDKDQEEIYNQVCEAWEKQVGNDVQGRLEFADYELLAQISVNDYLAIKKGNEPLKDRIKKKGDFLTDYELHKNKSKRVVPIALEKYLTEGIPVEETIRNHRNIYDFGIAKKASRDYYYKSVDRTTGKVITYDRLIRYYCSKNKGEKLWKCKHEHSSKTGPAQSQCESKSQRQVVFNQRPEIINWDELDIDYDYYIAEAKKILHQIFPEMKSADKITASGALTLF